VAVIAAASRVVVVITADSAATEAGRDFELFMLGGFLNKVAGVTTLSVGRIYFCTQSHAGYVMQYTILEFGLYGEGL
jgi:hypothetical protein